MSKAEIILTKMELASYSKRFYQIQEKLENDFMPEEIEDNLVNELEEIRRVVTKSLKAASIKESGLRLVK